MPEIRVMNTSELPCGHKKTVKLGETEILLIHYEKGLVAVQSQCPHAGAPLKEGAICNGRLVCPWHMGTFELSTGALVEPPPMESLKMYPVRVEGGEILVNPEPLPTATSTPVQKEELVLLAGTGAAGAIAATTLRQCGFAGRILAVDPVEEEPVDRTVLSKMALSGEMPLDQIGLSTFSAIQVERIHAAVLELSAAQKEAHLSNGSVVKFDKALVATGGKPKQLEIPGAELAYTIRHPRDVQRILKAAEGKKEAVIVGTSFIGLEAASALVQKGLRVTVVGKEKLPFAKLFGEEVAHALKALHESKGTRFRLEVETSSFDSSGVTIRAGEKDERLPADLIIAGVGILPDLEFKHDLPRAKDGGIATDASLRAKGEVWVAGDIASVSGTRIEHWRLAQQHGRVAALAMLGQDSRYEGVPFFWTFHYGKQLEYLGHTEDWDEVVIDGDLKELNFMAFYIKQERIAAVLSCERETQTAMLAEVMRSHPTLEQARQAIA